MYDSEWEKARRECEEAKTIPRAVNEMAQERIAELERQLAVSQQIIQKLQRDMVLAKELGFKAITIAENELRAAIVLENA